MNENIIPICVIEDKNGNYYEDNESIRFKTTFDENTYGYEINLSNGNKSIIQVDINPTYDGLDYAGHHVHVKSRNHSFTFNEEIIPSFDNYHSFYMSRHLDTDRNVDFFIFVEDETYSDDSVSLDLFHNTLIKTPVFEKFKIKCHYQNI